MNLPLADEWRITKFSCASLQLNLYLFIIILIIGCGYRQNFLRKVKRKRMTYTIKQACEKTGMTYQGLKFYCNEGLVPNVKRDKNNRRIFDDHDIEWIKCLLHLRNCGMGIQEMKDYLDLCLKGEITIPKRKKILEKKVKDVKKRIAVLEGCLKFIDNKQKFYDDVLTGKIKYFSNLLPEYFPDKK